MRVTHTIKLGNHRYFWKSSKCFNICLQITTTKFQNSSKKILKKIKKMFFFLLWLPRNWKLLPPPLIVAHLKIIIARREKKLLRGIFKIWILENNYCPFENNYCPFAKNYCASCQKNPPTRAAGARKFCDFWGKTRLHFIKISRHRREKILRF